MKLLNSSLLVLALAAGTATFAAAQDQAPTETAAAQQQQAAPRHQPNPKREAKMLAKRLNLTADQTAQIEPILADRMQRVQTLEANTSLDRKTMHQQHKAIMEDTDARLNAVLTPDQQQQYAQLKAQRHERPSQPMQPAAPPALL
jgi:Spy/CpxP family protein refolding chaperone